MTSIFNYIATVALAIVVAAGAVLVYVLYIHFAQPPTPTVTTPSATTVPPTTQSTPQPSPTQPPATTTTPSPSQRSTVKSVVLYIATPEVITTCAPGLGNKYIYYFNVTVERVRVEDPVSFYMFKARAGNATLNLTSASYLPLNGEFFKPYSINVTQLGLVNIYLEALADKSLNIIAVEYLGNEYLISRAVYVSCVKGLKVINATNGQQLAVTTLSPGALGLIPANAAYRVNMTLPPGRYRLIAPPGVQIEPIEVEGGKPQILTIKLQENKPQVYNPLVINAAKVS